MCQKITFVDLNLNSINLTFNGYFYPNSILYINYSISLLSKPLLNTSDGFLCMVEWFIVLLLTFYDCVTGIETASFFTTCFIWDLELTPLILGYTIVILLFY